MKSASRPKKGHGFNAKFHSFATTYPAMGGISKRGASFVFRFMFPVHAVIAKWPGSRCAKADKTLALPHQDEQRCCFAVKAAWNVPFTWCWLSQKHLLVKFTPCGTFISVTRPFRVTYRKGFFFNGLFSVGQLTRKPTRITRLSFRGHVVFLWMRFLFTLLFFVWNQYRDEKESSKVVQSISKPFWIKPRPVRKDRSSISV